MSTGHELYAADETFREVADLLFGGGADLITKANPSQSDLHAKKSLSDHQKRKITAGLSAVGAAAGAAGLTLGGHNLRRGYRQARYGIKGAQKAKGALKPIATKKESIKAAVKGEKLATGLIPLEVAGLTGEVAATKILHGDTKKKKPVSKMSGKKAAVLGTSAAAAGGGLAIGGVAIDNKRHGRRWNQGAPRRPGQLIKKDISEIAEAATTNPKRQMTRAAITNAPKAAGKGLEYSKVAHGQLKLLPDKVVSNKAKKVELKAKKVEKRSEDVEVIWSGDIAKANLEKQQLFGWASVIEMDGQPVTDLQGDVITADEMEKAGYEYVMKSRSGGDMHLRDNWQAIKKSEMIESFIVTDEKKQAMGLPDSVPTGWWVGFQVKDPEVWAKVKSGERTGFSIHGTGKRTPT